MSFDVRDRARFLKAVTSEPKAPGPEAGGEDGAAPAGDAAPAADAAGGEGEGQKFSAISRRAVDILFCPKSAVHLPCVVEARDRFEIGSLSFMVRHSAPGYQALADFPPAGTDPRVRDPPIIEHHRAPPPQARGAGEAPMAGAQGGDDFYGSDSESGSYTSGSESGSYTSGSGSGSYTSGSESESDSDEE